MLWEPDIIAEIALASVEDGGRSVSTPSEWFGCPFVLPNGEHHDGRLDLSERAPMFPGESAVLPVKFLDARAVVPKIEVGAVLQLWEGRVIGSATVLAIGHDA